MQYDAITFDTQTVRHNGFAFDDGALQTLKDLKDRPIHVVVSEVVRLEILKHTDNHLAALASDLHNATRKALEHKVFSGQLFEKVSRESIRELAQSSVGAYLDEIGAESIGHDGISVPDLMNRYFSGLPPFSETGKKKHEFPDAITLIALESWAEHNNYRLLAISGDGDWVNFGKNSEWIDVYPTIPVAMNIINAQAVEVKKAAIAALHALSARSNEHRSNEMHDLLANAVERETPYVECYSDVEVEADNANLRLIDFEFGDIEDAKLVRTHGSEVTLEVSAVLRVDANAPLSFSVYDSTDGDYVTIGGGEEHIEAVFPVELLVSISLDGTDFAVDDVYISSFPKSIDFGHVTFNSSNDFYGG